MIECGDVTKLKAVIRALATMPRVLVENRTDSYVRSAGYRLDIKFLGHIVPGQETKLRALGLYQLHPRGYHRSSGCNSSLHSIDTCAPSFCSTAYSDGTLGGHKIWGTTI